LPDRSPLPGQVHPGLGLFDEVVALLIIACERVGLAGLLVTPSQYHLAVQWQKRLRFVDPRAAARMRAIREAMPGMSLTHAALALAAGRVVDDRTGEACSYEPAAMVFPLSDELKAELAPETYLHAVDEAADAFRLRLRPDRAALAVTAPPPAAPRTPASRPALPRRRAPAPPRPRPRPRPGDRPRPGGPGRRAGPRARRGCAGWPGSRRRRCPRGQVPSRPEHRRGCCRS